MDLLWTKNIVLTVIAAVFTYLQTKLTTLAKPATPSVPGQKVPDMGKMMWFMNIFLVFMIGSFVYTMQIGVGLYIVTTTVFSVAQYARQYRALLKAKRGERTSRGKGIVINPK
jgi:membrane protein insertase Oxa1/YidC/SpoIIIJ